MKCIVFCRISSLLILLITAMQVHTAEFTGVLLSFQKQDVPDFINSHAPLAVSCSDLGRTIQSLPWVQLQVGVIKEEDSQGFNLVSFNDAILSDSIFKRLTLSEPQQTLGGDSRLVLEEDIAGNSTDDKTTITLSAGPWQHYVLAVIPPDGVWYQLLFIYNTAFNYCARIDGPCQLVSHYPPAKLTVEAGPTLNFTRFPQTSEAFTDNPDLARFGWYWPIRVLQSRMIDCFDPDYKKQHPSCPTLFWNIKPSQDSEEEQVTVTPDDSQDKRIYRVWNLDNHCPNGQFTVSADSASGCTIGRETGSFAPELFVSVPRVSNESTCQQQTEPFPPAEEVADATLNYTSPDLKSCCQGSLEAVITSDRSDLAETHRGKVLKFQSFQCKACNQTFALGSPVPVISRELIQQSRSGYSLLISSGLAQKTARLYFSRASGDQWLMAFETMEDSVQQLILQYGADSGQVQQATIFATTALAEFHNKDMVYLNLNTSNILRHTAAGNMALAGCGQLRPVPALPVTALPESIIQDGVALPPECLVHSGIDGRAQDVWFLGVLIYRMIIADIPDAVFEKSQGFDPEVLISKIGTENKSCAQAIKLLSQLLCSHPAERTSPAALLEGAMKPWRQ
ncbi:protein kinase domain-containing protein [Endozoicomonadaceae bacterium StTr2]